MSKLDTKRISRFWDLSLEPNATWVTVVRDEQTSRPRWFAGEPGILLVNTYPEKYDAEVILGPEYGPYVESWYRDDWWGAEALLGQDRIFYFYACDLAYRSGPGYGRWRP